MSAKHELRSLISKVKAANPEKVEDVRAVIETYFNKEVHWSGLKDEWQNHLNDEQRSAFAARVYQDVHS